MASSPENNPLMMYHEDKLYTSSDGTTSRNVLASGSTSGECATSECDGETMPLTASSIKQTVPGVLPVRYQLGVLMFFAMTVICAMRQNVAVALVAMTTGSNYTSDDAATSNETGIETCNANGGNTTEDSKEAGGGFPWSTQTQELILAAFFYGYIFTQAAGGWLSDRFGIKWVMGIGILISSGATLLGPTAAKASADAYFVTRVIAGLGEGVTFPAMLSAWATWAHPSERSRLSASGYAGINFGFIFGAVVSGNLCTLDIAGGWPLGFYFFGALGVVWFITWCICVQNTPEQHAWISREEREYLKEGLSMTKKSDARVPWSAILTSCDVWVLIIAQFANAWGTYVLYTNLPLYLGSGMDLSIIQTGIYSALPYCLTLVVLVVGGYAADGLVSRQFLTAHNTRRLMNTLGFGSFAVFLAAASIAKCNIPGAVTCVVLGIGLNGCAYSGYYVSVLDVCGPFAGSVMGIMTMVGTTVGIFGPYVVGVLTEVQTDIRGWQNVLWMLSGLYLFGGVIFAVFGTSKLQPWAVVPENNVSK